MQLWRNVHYAVKQWPWSWLLWRIVCAVASLVVRLVQIPHRDSGWVLWPETMQGVRMKLTVCLYARPCVARCCWVGKSTWPRCVSCALPLCCVVRAQVHVNKCCWVGMSFQRPHLFKLCALAMDFMRTNQVLHPEDPWLLLLLCMRALWS